MPLVNADRLTLSLLPPPGADNQLRPWASRLRDEDERWQRLSQQGVQVFLDLAMQHRMSFAFETVFSHLEPQPDGTFKSKADLIRALKARGYRTVLLFVGLASAELSILRVSARKAQGGHTVPEDKLRSRFPRTQRAIGIACQIADVTLLLDNSRSLAEAFTLVRAQRQSEIIYDCRNPELNEDIALREVAEIWLAKVAPAYCA
jgi:predicted ABC-type ATPase